MKIEDLKQEDLITGKTYILFHDNNYFGIVEYEGGYISDLKEVKHWTGLQQDYSDRNFTIYLASDIKPPIWETRPDDLQELNYDNRNFVEKGKLINNPCPPNCGCYHVCQGHGGKSYENQG